MLRKISFIALVLVAAAIAVPVAQAKAVDPLAVSLLQSEGMSPAQVEAWTTGVCSYRVKPQGCYLTPAQQRAASLWTGESFARLEGMTPRAIAAWTSGVCSHRVKPAECFTTYASGSQPVDVAAGGGGFHWGDAGIGAAAAFGLFLLVGGLGALVIVRHPRTPRHT
jgi:hypothetical protein